MKKKQLKYPIVKYRVVNGYGYSVCNSWEEVEAKIQYYKTDPIFKDDDKYQIKHIIKVTEEYIEL